jgi:hypothetical protein
MPKLVTPLIPEQIYSTGAEGEEATEAVLVDKNREPAESEKDDELNEGKEDLRKESFTILENGSGSEGETDPIDKHRRVKSMVEKNPKEEDAKKILFKSEDGLVGKFLVI